MSTPCTPQRARPSPRWRWSPVPGPDLRVSDAERNEVADRLSKHYSDGRLDETEFGERLDRAMSAKTQSDLHGLLADLPGDEPPRGRQRPPRQRPQRPSLARIILLAFLVVVAVAIGQAILHMYLFWLVVALLVFLLLRHGPWRGR
jgi:Flp pilus assembly protein TadB